MKYKGFNLQNLIMRENDKSQVWNNSANQSICSQMIQMLGNEKHIEKHNMYIFGKKNILPSTLVVKIIKKKKGV